jgi:hypothetical protein
MGAQNRKILLFLDNAPVHPDITLKVKPLWIVNFIKEGWGRGWVVSKSSSTTRIDRQFQAQITFHFIKTWRKK